MLSSQASLLDGLYHTLRNHRALGLCVTCSNARPELVRRADHKLHETVGDQAYREYEIPREPRDAEILQATYEAGVRYLDEALGQMFDSLRASGACCNAPRQEISSAPTLGFNILSERKKSETLFQEQASSNKSHQRRRGRRLALRE